MPSSQVDGEGSVRTESRDAARFGVREVLRRQHPKVVVKADLLPALSVLSTVGLIGIPVGWIWAQLAPPQRVRVLSDGSLVAPELESWHQFDALVIFALLCIAAGVIVGALVWMLRERRGPVAMIAAVCGSLLAAWLAGLMGEMFVAGMYEVTGAPEVGDVVTRAPQPGTPLVLVAQPFATALTYGLLAAWNGTDDLGRRLG
ncbi:DUF2567 domain-containing protein [Haloechinothrix aidingensis]|uniref:DUF2567 domain-containing protein n=1 Tax=Haloechinothrix aidingensis TaxID=2752311 RepID=UPI0031B643F3